ncbi:glucosaminidase domain-containing protein [Shewanella marina]|uniref:glucosaminidase domain-containing protein n=1 Tax=Shewanella marina TaxID=487319 RepID=UPI00046FED0A|nr:glucosaminidase domain-containing protein [Shewanella marina]
MKTGRIARVVMALCLLVLTILAVSYYLKPAKDSDSQLGLGKLIENIIPKQPTLNIPDFASIKDIPTKKNAFFNYLRPAIIQQNKLIEKQRQFIIHFQQQLENKQAYSEAEGFELQQIADQYQYNIRDLEPDTLTALLKRVDVIPENMVLIQAANETGWGSSRFAREGRNFFGQWCFKQGCGLVPLSRTEGMNHEVAVFKSMDASVASYMNNLNTNGAYQTFRDIRADLRANHQPLTAEKLVYGLINYSERKQAYIDELLEMLRHNQRYLGEQDAKVSTTSE